MILDPDSGHRLLFIDVDKLHNVDGRIHLDLAPRDRRRDDEVERVVALGASEVADRRNSDGTGWIVLADPDGKHFCILRSEGTRRNFVAKPDRRSPSREIPGALGPTNVLAQRVAHRRAGLGRADRRGEPREGWNANDVSPSRDGIAGDGAHAALTDDESDEHTEYQRCDEGCRWSLGCVEQQAEQAVADEPGDHQCE